MGFPELDRLGDLARAEVRNFLSVWPKDMRGRPRKVKSISGARRVVGCVQQGVRGVPSGPAAKPFLMLLFLGVGVFTPVY